jgi:hypothetical protein
MCEPNWRNSSSEEINKEIRFRAEMIRERRLWHPWLRINRVLRVMLHTRWSVEAWSQVRVEFKKALAQRSEIRRAGWFKLGACTPPRLDPSYGCCICGKRQIGKVCPCPPSEDR